ncbi:exocyst subunit EXO70 family protein [Striga asiatica]|uniref:Exocyst subunit Exo70 family protein n=1 Tax=Striga asiatica TaxID=4170 RepID=A0A5A7QE21_STRAF|nr:exocyst subunit EXO70 family protein [Striga asiatica]
MPRKGMRSLCFSPKTKLSSFTPSSPSRFGFSPARPSFSDSVMNRTLEISEPIITKWDPETTAYARVTSLFHESRHEARDFVKTVNNLLKAIHFVPVETSGSGFDKLGRAQSLMRVAMKRLQKEFYQILSMNRAHLDPESVSARSSRTSIGSASSYNDDDESSASEDDVTSLLAMSDLRLIAECMISASHAKECLEIYRVIRKSIVDEGIYKLGVEKLSSSQVNKSDPETLDWRVETWLAGVSTAVKTLFTGERILCDHVFASDDSLRESCFADVTREGAQILFAFPECVARHGAPRGLPERIFRLLDMHRAISGLLPEIESVFSGKPSGAARAQALAALERLAESACVALGEFEATVIKEPVKLPPVAEGGVHGLTIDVTAYLSGLAEYGGVLSEVLPPESDSPETAVGRKMAWLLLMLLCNLDAKAKRYKDVSLSYLFLVNNLQYVVVKARGSKLGNLLGEEWFAEHEYKVKQFVERYERLGWGHVIDSIPSDPTAADAPPAKVREIFKKFNTAFDQACRKQGVFVVVDSKLRDQIKISLARKICGPYREFYIEHREKMERERFSASVVRYAPEDVGHQLSDLFWGDFESGGLFVN